MYRIVCVELEAGEQLDCCSPPSLALHEGDACIVQDGRTLESGTIRSVTEQSDTPPDTAAPSVVRCVTLQDQARIRENQVRGKMARETCMAQIEALKLPVRLVHVRYSFDRKKLVIQFSAEDRLDFHELIQNLSRELETQVELRQIGVRDEAGLIGGIGPCGRRMCCCDWLKKFDSVNVKMAKNQQLSLNPATISGMCGRLKCCLRYENDMYVKCSRGLPRHGAGVECPDGQGTVAEVNILVRKVKVRLEDGRLVEYPLDDIRILDGGRLRRRRAPRGGGQEE